jgi:hypothetical protein
MIVRRVACTWVASVAWLLALSAWLGVAPGAPVVTRNNVLFQVDVASHYRELTGLPDPFSPGKPRVSAPHPFLPQIWGTVGAAAAAALARTTDPATARILGARVMVAAVAAAGLAALAWLAAVEAVPITWFLCLLAVAWLSSAMTIVALPDHFGLSYGLLLVTFVGGWSSVTCRRHGWWALVAGLLAIATTVTNGVFVGMVFAWMGWRPAGAAWRAHRGHRGWQAAAVVLVAAVGIALAFTVPPAARRIGSGQTIVTKYFHGELLRSPAAALVCLPLTWTFPTVAAAPRVAGPPGEAGVTLEPWTVADYSPLGAAGALGILALAVAFIGRVMRPSPSGEAAVLLNVWVAFNWTFHSVWGDERFLYTPHWAWVFPVMLVLSSREGRVPRWFWPVAAVIVCAEVASLAAILALARSVS